MVSRMVAYAGVRGANHGVVAMRVVDCLERLLGMHAGRSGT
jgi:hypothetical protein